MISRVLLACGLMAFCAAGEAAELRYWIEAAPAGREGDRQLARWALEAWQRESEGRLQLVESSREEAAQIRVYWVSQRNGLYGEARPILVDGKRGAELYVRPEMDGLGEDIAAAAARDPLLRDAIVYLTCVHEAGHAFGLGHTAAFSDIMYSFGYGGDLVEYFQRYRRKLTSRQDIPRHSGISAADRARLLKVL